MEVRLTLAAIVLALIVFDTPQTGCDCQAQSVGVIPTKQGTARPAVSEPEAGYVVVTPVVSEPPGQYDIVGLAHWYHPKYTGRTMANGQPLDQDKHTIATWLPIPLGSRVKIVSEYGEVLATVTDRMPRPKQGQVIMDATNAVADEIMPGYGFNSRGVAYGSVWVTLTVQSETTEGCQ